MRSGRGAERLGGDDMRLLTSGQQADGTANFGLRMGRRNEETQAWCVFRYTDLENWRHVIAIVHQLLKGGECFFRTRENDRDDATPDGRARIQTSLSRQFDEELGVVAEFFDPP